ncbi:MAG: hypothetical protein V3T72_22680 [Thermoanaerobaculia bacterium]
MKNEENGRLSKGVRDRCANARSLCAKLEAQSDGISAALPKLLIHVIRQLIARLLAAETIHLETLAALSPARCRRDAAIEALYRQLSVFRQVGMWNRGPVVPSGRLPREPRQLLAVAAGVRQHLDSPDLCQQPGATFGVRFSPELQPVFDQATSELSAALAELEEADRRSRKTRKARDEAMNDLDAHLSAARSVQRALCDLRTLASGRGR